MTNTETVRGFLEKVLAHAHAALEDPTTERIRRAKLLAAEVFPRLRRLGHQDLTLTEARELIALMTKLRGVMGAVARLPTCANVRALSAAAPSGQAACRGAEPEVIGGHDDHSEHRIGLRDLGHEQGVLGHQQPGGGRHD